MESNSKGLLKVVLYSRPPQNVKLRTKLASEKSCAVRDGTEMYKKRDARVELLFCQSKPTACFSF